AEKIMCEAQWNRFNILLGLRFLVALFVALFVVDLLFDWLRFFFANGASPTVDLWNRLLETVRATLKVTLIIWVLMAFSVWRENRHKIKK
ncbi:MAG TPA: hypothetical protein VGB77_22460, partial [Abditibacteriaceae bacterium]